MSATQTGSHRNEHKGMQVLLAKTTRKVWTSSLHENKEYPSRNSRILIFGVPRDGAFGLPSCVSKGIVKNGVGKLRLMPRNPQEQASDSR